MYNNIPISQKLGCDKYALENCILVKASVEDVSTILKQYFELEVRSNCKLAQYIQANNAVQKEVERQRLIKESRPNKSFPPIVSALPFWRYFGIA